jgi:hypothetical protein
MAPHDINDGNTHHSSQPPHRRQGIQITCVNIKPWVRETRHISSPSLATPNAFPRVEFKHPRLHLQCHNRSTLLVVESLRLGAIIPILAVTTRVVVATGLVPPLPHLLSLDCRPHRLADLPQDRGAPPGSLPLLCQKLRMARVSSWSSERPQPPKSRQRRPWRSSGRLRGNLADERLGDNRRPLNM